jgi:hypothetical protein
VLNEHKGEGSAVVLARSLGGEAMPLFKVVVNRMESLRVRTVLEAKDREEAIQKSESLDSDAFDLADVVTFVESAEPCSDDEADDQKNESDPDAFAVRWARAMSESGTQPAPTVPRAG